MRKMRFVTDELNFMSRDEITQLQEKKLLKQMRYVYNNSEFYRKKFNESGVLPRDIRTIEDE